MDDILKALQACMLFKGLDQEQLLLILSKTQYNIRTYSKNEFICREDELSANVGIIIYGCIEIQKVFATGNLVCFFHKNSGELFGGAVAFSNESLYPCDVYSRDVSKILFFSKQNIFEMCKNALFAENLLNSFANRILYYEKKLELFSYSSIKAKIAYYLLLEMKSNGNSTVRLSFSKKTWAEYLNVSRPSLCRELKKLENDQFVKIDKENISILNEQALENLLQQ